MFTFSLLPIPATPFHLSCIVLSFFLSLRYLSFFVSVFVFSLFFFILVFWSSSLIFILMSLLHISFSLRCISSTFFPPFLSSLSLFMPRCFVIYIQYMHLHFLVFSFILFCFLFSLFISLLCRYFLSSFDLLTLLHSHILYFRFFSHFIFLCILLSPRFPILVFLPLLSVIFFCVCFLDFLFFFFVSIFYWRAKSFIFSFSHSFLSSCTLFPGLRFPSSIPPKSFSPPPLPRSVSAPSLPVVVVPSCYLCPLFCRRFSHLSSLFSCEYSPLASLFLTHSYAALILSFLV